MKLTKAQITLINKIINARLSSKEVAELSQKINDLKSGNPEKEDEYDD